MQSSLRYKFHTVFLLLFVSNISLGSDQFQKVQDWQSGPKKSSDKALQKIAQQESNCKHGTEYILECQNHTEYEGKGWDKGTCQYEWRTGFNEEPNCKCVKVCREK
jgi:hypothetical protein